MVSDLVGTNPSESETVFGVASFFDPGGQPLEIEIVGEGTVSSVAFEIPPLDSVTISPGSGGGSLKLGSAVVQTNRAAGGVIRFNLDGFGPAGVGAGFRETAAVAPVRRQLGGINTAVAIRNPGNEECTYDLSLRSQAQEAGSTQKTIPAQGRIAEFIDQLFPDVDTDDFLGTLVIETDPASNCLFTAIALELGGPGEFTTLPVTPL